MARHDRQNRTSEWGAPVMNRGKALVRDIRQIVATHDLADIQIRRKVELLAEIAEPNGLERATMQMELGKIRARQCEIARRCTDRMFGGGYAGREGAMATTLGRILNRYRIEIDMVNLAIDTAATSSVSYADTFPKREGREVSPSVKTCGFDSSLIRGSQGDDEGFSPSVRCADSSLIRGSQGDDVGFSPSVSGGAADSSLIRGSQEVIA